MDVKMIELILLGGILIQASIIGAAADKISEKDREVSKLANQGNGPEETAAVRALSLKKMISQKSLLKEDHKEYRKKRAGNAQKRQEEKTCMCKMCHYDHHCCTESPNCNQGLCEKYFRSCWLK